MYEALRPSDPDPPAAAPWRFQKVSIHTIEHVEPPVGACGKGVLEGGALQQRGGGRGVGWHPAPWRQECGTG
jgi:hypothetical protein